LVAEESKTMKAPSPDMNASGESLFAWAPLLATEIRVRLIDAAKTGFGKTKPNVLPSKTRMRIEHIVKDSRALKNITIS